jgi:hypothetical protein
MQHVDRIGEVQSLAEPAGLRGVRVDVYSLRVVLTSEVFGRIDWLRIGWRHRREKLAVWSAEPELTVELPGHLIALLVDRTMMSAAEQGQIRERRGSAMRPVLDVVPLTESHATTREAAAVISVVKRAS